MQFLGFRRFVSDRLHGEVEHHFIAAAMRLFGDFNGVCMIGQNGDRQRIRQSKDGVGSRTVAAQIVEDDGERSSLALFIRARCERG